MNRLLTFFACCYFAVVANAEAQLDEAQLLLRSALSNHYGYAANDQIRVLDKLSGFYAGEQRYEEAYEVGLAAFNLRLDHADSSAQTYSAYQSFGDLLTATGQLSRAAEIFRDGANDPKVQAPGQVNLLVSLARLGLLDKNFLRWGTRSMVRAGDIAKQAGIAQPELLDLGFADLLMVAGDIEAAKKLYRALWHAEPLQRELWFGEPTLIHTGIARDLFLRRGVEDVALLVSTSGKAQVSSTRVLGTEIKGIAGWLEKAIYRPAMRAGQFVAVEISLGDVPVGNLLAGTGDFNGQAD